MWIDRVRPLVLIVALFPTSLAAEDPLSAIDWLSDSVTTPVKSPISDSGDITDSALPEDVQVTTLGQTLPDAVGLLPTSVTGLPRDLWGSSSSTDLARRLLAIPDDQLPAMQELLLTLLLAELDPPADASSATELYLARIDKLLSIGALRQAEALLDRAGANQSAIFKRKFDTALLLGSEDKACDILRNSPGLSPTFPARIFCHARGGDWDAAALTLETGRALGLLTEQDDALIARFLHPELSDGAEPLPIPQRPNPLVFRMMAAIGEAMPTSNLPRAFANADINANTGWKAQIEAAERLAQTGAIDPNRLLGLYTERLPAASGGIWSRVEAIQRFDVAIRAGDPSAVSASLPVAWAEMEKAELETTFASLYATQLARLPVSGTVRPLVFRILLLSDLYETGAEKHVSADPEEQFLLQIAQGNVKSAPSRTTINTAVADGFKLTGIPIRLQSLVNDNRLGEAILRAMMLFSDGVRGDLDEVSDALGFFRAIGLEETARQAALQLLLLERRG